MALKATLTFANYHGSASYSWSIKGRMCNFCTSVRGKGVP